MPTLNGPCGFFSAYNPTSELPRSGVRPFVRSSVRHSSRVPATSPSSLSRSSERLRSSMISRCFGVRSPVRPHARSPVRAFASAASPVRPFGRSPVRPDAFLHSLFWLVSSPLRRSSERPFVRSPVRAFSRSGVRPFTRSCVARSSERPRLSMLSRCFAIRSGVRPFGRSSAFPQHPHHSTAHLKGASP